MPSAGPTSGATSACPETLLSLAEVGPEVEAELPAIPEVPGYFPEVPASRVFAASRWSAGLGGGGSTGLWGGTTGHASFFCSVPLERSFA